MTTDPHRGCIADARDDAAAARRALLAHEAVAGASLTSPTEDPTDRWALELAILTGPESPAAGLEPPSDGKMRTVTIGVGVVFEVRNSGDELLASATLSDSAEVSITDEAYTASQYGQASGSGSVTVNGE